MAELKDTTISDTLNLAGTDVLKWNLKSTTPTIGGGFSHLVTYMWTDIPGHRLVWIYDSGQLQFVYTSGISELSNATYSLPYDKTVITAQPKCAVCSTNPGMTGNTNFSSTNLNTTIYRPVKNSGAVTVSLNWFLVI